MLRAYRCAEIRNAEEPLLRAGVPLMEQAASALASEVIRAVRACDLPLRGTGVFVAVGSGNNGADALYCAAKLARREMDVTALCVGSNIHSEALADAVTSGVRIERNTSAEIYIPLAERCSIWIDGLLGIGSHGPLRGAVAGVVTALESTRVSLAVEPIVVAVDIPTGVSADDGAVSSAAIKATFTVSMGCLKPGTLLEPGRSYCGDVVEVPLGFEEFLPGEPAVLSLTRADVGDIWPLPGAYSHKYTRGVVGLMSGSAAYPGAAVLSVGAALAAGPGMVRYCGPREVARQVVGAHPEVVVNDGRVQAWAIGSGVDMTDSVAASEAARRLYKAIGEGIPVVLDAGAISLVTTQDVPSSVVLTPHSGELAQLLAARGEKMTRADVENAPARAVRLAATLTGATVMLTAHSDLVCGPDTPMYAQSGAPSWRATAGAGDVQAGLLAAMLAGWGSEGMSERGVAAHVSAGAAWVHARAAAIASHSSGRIGHPIRSSEIIDAIPWAIDEALNEK